MDFVDRIHNIVTGETNDDRSVSRQLLEKAHVTREEFAALSPERQSEIVAYYAGAKACLRSQMEPRPGETKKVTTRELSQRLKRSLERFDEE